MLKGSPGFVGVPGQKGRKGDLTVASQKGAEFTFFLSHPYEQEELITFTMFVGLWYMLVYIYNISPQDIQVTLEIQEEMVWQEYQGLQAQMVVPVSMAAVVFQ